MIDARGRLSPDQVRVRLAQETTTQRDHGVQYWPIFLLDTGEHVGCCGLRPRDAEHGVYELGVHIRPRYWRRGLAYEATTAVVRYAFDRLGAQSLFAGHNPTNEASRHLVEKLGFRFTHVEHYPATGLPHPSYTLEAAAR